MNARHNYLQATYIHQGKMLRSLNIGKRFLLKELNITFDEFTTFWIKRWKHKPKSDVVYICAMSPKISKDLKHCLIHLFFGALLNE